jgi:hypothetical protein
MLAQPGVEVERVARFLGEPFEREAAVRGVRPELKHQNA